MAPACALLAVPAPFLLAATRRSTCRKAWLNSRNSLPFLLPAALPAAAGALLPLACRLPGILPRDRGFRQSSKPRILDRLLFLPAFPSRGPWVSVEPLTQQVAYSLASLVNLEGSGLARVVEVDPRSCLSLCD